MSNQFYTGTLLSSPIVRGSSGDSYGTHHSSLGVGGLIEVKTIAERNAIPIDSVNGIYFDGISSGQRRLGMLVYVYENKTLYQLEPTIPYSTFSGYTDSVKRSVLSDNLNWQTLFSVADYTILGDQIYKSFTQSTHGFVVGDIIGFDKVSDLYIKSSSTNALTVEPLGVVTEVSGLNDFTLTFSGYVDSSTMKDVNSNLLSGGTLYFVSSVAGKLTSIQPTGLNEVSKPMLVTLSGGFTAIVLQYNGKNRLTEGVDYTTFSGYTGTTKLFLNKTVTGGTNVGYFNGKTGVQTLVINNTLPTYSGNYISLYNYYYRDISGLIRIGTPTYDLIPRQGYLRDDLVKSWVWNEYTGGGDQVGWITINGDISTNVGLSLTSVTTATPYIETGWTNGVFYNNGGDIVLDVVGSLTTGSTFTNQGPIYSDKTNYNLNFRTLQSKNTNAIKVTYDDNFVYLSGASQSGLINDAVNGLCKIGYNAELGGILTKNTCICGSDFYEMKFTNINLFRVESLSTVFKDNAITPVGIVYNGDYSANYVDRSLVDKAYVINQIGAGAGGVLASNGLIKTLNYIKLGGTLTQNTLIDGDHTYGLDLSKLTTLNISSANGVYQDTAVTPSGLTYYADYSANYTNRSLVDKAYVSRMGGIRNIVDVTDGTYSVIDNDYFINVKTAILGVMGKYNIFLPPLPDNGREIVVTDIGGYASSTSLSEIHIWGTGGLLILNWSEAVINTDYGSITFYYNGKFWSVIAFTAAPSYS